MYPRLSLPSSLPPRNQDNDGNISEADTAAIEDGADDVAAGDVTAGLDDSMLGGGGGGGGGEEDEAGGRYDIGEGVGETGGAGEDGILDVGSAVAPVAMVPEVRKGSVP